MEVWIERDDETETLKFEGKAYDLLKKLGLNDQEVVIARDSKIITKDDILKDSDKIKLLSVISGG